MTAFETMRFGDVRLRWVWDDDYQTRGSYGLDTEEETRKAEDWELERLADGRLIPLGCIVDRVVDCDCPDCDGWHETDSCFGIVIEPDDAELIEYARWNGWIPKDRKVS